MSTLRKIADKRVVEPEEFVEQKLLGVAEETLSKDFEVFKQLGMKNNEIVDVYKEREKSLAFNATKKEYGHAAYTPELLMEMAVAYNLRLLRTQYYKGKVPVNIASDIAKFCAKHEIAIEDYDSERFFILAPEESFILEEVKQRPKDPILLYRLDDNTFMPVTSWGTELSFFRYLFSWQKRSNDHASLYTFVVFGVLTMALSIAFVGAEGWWFWMSVAIGIVCGAAVMGMNSSWRGDKQWRGTNDIWDEKRQRKER